METISRSRRTFSTLKLIITDILKHNNTKYRWWGPVGYGGNDTSKEFQAYVDANFTIALVSDRGSDRCTGHAETDSKDSWNFIVDQLNACEKAGIQGIVDTYRCTPWFNTQTYGGASQGTSNGYVTRTFNHKITLPEVQMLAKELVKIPNVRIFIPHSHSYAHLCNDRITGRGITRHRRRC